MKQCPFTSPVTSWLVPDVLIRIIFLRKAPEDAELHMQPGLGAGLAFLDRHFQVHYDCFLKETTVL